ncbi:MAG: hypothetical protein A3A94_03535 [Candidatus Portnoybacteria bacterium RIFCSPLOWO2_01_FULL_43_11]|uniref:4Fe-4S ferredoxin-type domain-containing protein n=4 Tax=Bacteria candidate phyla TaxID=1783234 RepID=A0A1G2FS18_9BACT|nr:MAG: hypothetical protein A2713_01870 [candidate division WWE3 bacterium RIFCSPHIGHO2_01_FULL_35_17]OGZ38422.1 MAG: hypothetical protein A3A94_03535 [Candidatus Portnoybacteria bacterium RIFCSPLOWO2_01_FULL_43_11]OGZ40823.1 MAG: hypothetical protein A3I20_02360 [Candidatus Portnoybacteria bacterium RIFCSPLOWO2_02_FULL_40_15]
MSGVKIVKIKDYKENVREIFSALNFKIVSGEKILIKPNLVLPREAATGATTDLDLISALIEIIKENKAIPILAEGVGYEFDSRVFSILGIDKLVRKHDIQFIDLRRSKTFFKKTPSPIFKKIELPEILKEVHKIINVPKLKTHMLTGFSCGLKNLIGLLPLKERRKMHLFGLARSIVELNLIIPTHLTIVDASVIMHGKGPAFGDRIKLGYLLAGLNVFAVDFSAAQFLNINPLEIGHLKIAKKRGLIPEDQKRQTKTEDLSVVLPKNRFYNLLYWLVYFFDYLQEKITKKTSIAWWHRRFGMRPKLDIKKCHSFPACRDCLDICPVGAIKKETGLDFKKCAYIRCLKCFEVCPYEAIIIKGISRPGQNNG